MSIYNLQDSDLLHLNIDRINSEIENKINEFAIDKQGKLDT